MADKKYLDITGLGQYDAKIKALIDTKDAATLASAKSYADGLAGDYDAKGAAAQALTDAKAYTDAEIDKVEETVAGVKTTAEKGVADAATAQSAADAAQADVDALVELVGEIPSTATAETIVAYVDEKTSGIATEGAMTALTSRVTAAEQAIDAIEADYLVEADKTELTSAIATAKSEAIEAAVDQVLGWGAEEVNADFDTLKEVADWIASDTTSSAALVTRVSDAEKAIDAIEADYLKAADKTELQSTIDAKAAASDLTALAGRVTTAEGEIDTLQTDVAAAQTQADKGVSDAAAAKTAADNAQKEVDALELVVAEKAAQSDLEAAVTRIGTAEGKITTLEGKAHIHANTEVLDGLTAQLVSNWNDAASKAHTHANADVLDGITSALVTSWSNAEANSKAYTDEKIGEFTAITTSEVDALFA